MMAKGMTNSQRLATVRNRLLSWIAASDDEGTRENIVRETMLIRNEFFVGRRFYTDTHRGVWFIEEDELKIYGSDNQLLCVLTSAEIDAMADQPDHGAAGPDVIKMPNTMERNDDSDGEVRRAA